MTRVAVIPTLTDGRAGLWSTARSEGRIPLNWAALLAANGYDVVVVAQWPGSAECAVSGVAFLGPDEVGEVDWVIFGSTSVLGSNWFGRTTVRTKRVVRVQWPTGASVDHSGDIVAVAHRCLVEQVAAECGLARERLQVLPPPVLPLAWWDTVCGRQTAPWPERDCIVWAARDGFAGSYAPCGEAMLLAWEQSPILRGLRPLVLSSEQYDQAHLDRFRALGGQLASGLHLGEVLRAMRRAVLCVTQPAYMGPTLTEATFEGAPPLVWRRYGVLFPELAAAAARHDLLLDDPGQVRSVMERIVSDWKMRAEYTDSCRFAFADNSPERSLAAWKEMEARCA
jgi:hypothetical protein